MAFQYSRNMLRFQARNIHTVLMLPVEPETASTRQHSSNSERRVSGFIMKFAVSLDLKLTEVLRVPYRKYVEFAISKSK